jgi:ankyrin repeat protein
MKLLVAARADIGYVLHQVLRDEKRDAARILINGGADVALTDTDGNQPLHLAAARGLTEMVGLLLKAGASATAVNRPESDGETALHLAAEHGRDTIVAMLIDAGAPINLQDKAGRTALYRAVYGKHTAVAARLLRAGADPNLESDYTTARNTPVALAVSHNDATLLTMLLDAGADPNSSGRDVHYSPLNSAAGQGNAESVRLLLKAGAKVAVEPGRYSALHAAASSDSAAQVVPLLVAAGSPVDGKSDEDKTPLHVAATEKKVGAVKALLAAGASVQAVTKCGETPLWLALVGRYNREDTLLTLAEILIAAGSDVNARSSCHDNQTLLDVADQRGHLRLRRLLLAKGARPTRSS